jgi:hypothetical protein
MELLFLFKNSKDFKSACVWAGDLGDSLPLKETSIASSLTTPGSSPAPPPEIQIASSEGN